MWVSREGRVLKDDAHSLQDSDVAPSGVGVTVASEIGLRRAFSGPDAEMFSVGVGELSGWERFSMLSFLPTGGLERARTKPYIWVFREPSLQRLLSSNLSCLLVIVATAFFRVLSRVFIMVSMICW